MSESEGRLQLIGLIAGRVIGQELQVAGAHLVLRPDAIADAAGGPVRVARVVLGIVEISREGEQGSLGQADGFGIAVLVLPVEVPVGDPQQGLYGSVGQGRGQAKLATEIMGVGHSGVEVDVGPESHALNDFVPLPPAGMSIWSVLSE